MKLKRLYQQKFRIELEKLLKPRQLADIMMTLAGRAARGDVKAAQILLAYAVEKPKQRVDVSSSDQKLYGLTQEEADRV